MTGFMPIARTAWRRPGRQLPTGHMRSHGCSGQRISGPGGRTRTMIDRAASGHKRPRAGCRNQSQSGLLKLVRRQLIKRRTSRMSFSIRKVRKVARRIFLPMDAMIWPSVGSWKRICHFGWIAQIIQYLPSTVRQWWTPAGPMFMHGMPGPSHFFRRVRMSGGMWIIGRAVTG